jgi:hypothetical protein
MNSLLNLAGTQAGTRVEGIISNKFKTQQFFSSVDLKRKPTEGLLNVAV